MSPLPFDTPSPHLDALDSVVSSLAAVREQMHHLQAVEALLLSTGSLIADAVAAAGVHPDNGQLAHRAVAAELGAAVNESDRTVAVKMERAARVVNEYPTVYRALVAGRISQAHAAVIAECGEVIADRQARQRYEAAVLEHAVSNTVGRLRPIAKRLAEHYAERTFEERHEAARASRAVRVIEGIDGMADLVATLPALYAYGIKDRLDRMAHRVRVAPPSAPADERSVDEIRADLFTDMLLVGDPSELAAKSIAGLGSIAAHVQMVVPVKRMIGEPAGASSSAGAGEHPSAAGKHRSTSGEHGSAPGEHGSAPSSPGSRGPADHRVRTDSARDSSTAPSDLFADFSEALGIPGFDEAAVLGGGQLVDDETARRLAGAASSWDRIDVDSEDGGILSVDAYRPSAGMRRFLRARDEHCRFPGCRVPLRRCDIDHTVDAAFGGPTSTDNLAHLCRWHHTLKHWSGWRVEQDSGGVLTWTSPTGREYSNEPTSRVRFRPVRDEPPGSGDPRGREGPPGRSRSAPGEQEDIVEPAPPQAEKEARHRVPF